MSRWPLGLLSSFLLAGQALAASPTAEAPVTASVDFGATLRELRGALREVSELRQAVKKRGDAVKEACVYERQRAIAQAVDSTEEAQVAWEGAMKRGESGRAQKELARGEKAAELVRKLVSAAESCVGEELRGGTRPTTVTVKGPEKLDDPKAGPDELVRANQVRLELPSRPNPASVFRPSR
jgi:predicted transcriptional regulator